MKFFFLLTLSLFSLLHAELDYRVENSNIHIKDTDTYNYNRLRLHLNYNQDAYFTTFIADGINYYSESYVNSIEFQLLSKIKSDTPFKTQTSFNTYEDGADYAKVYRFFGGYEDDNNRISIGLQNITMGVGRFWNPTNIFNPKNIYAIEADETFGVMALIYTRHIDDTTDIHVVSSIKEDETLKYALRYKTFLDFADLALDIIYSDDTQMLGYEIEANLFDTGVEIRSEGAYMKSDLVLENDVEYFQAILGADYGFVNGINLTFESLYSSKEFTYMQMLSNLKSDILSNMTSSKFYAGASLSYAFNIFLDSSVMYIDSFDKKDAFSSLAFNYTLNDYNLFTFGIMNQENKTYYLKYQLSF
ncbi:MAG: hypothetical protein OQJ77_04845 [Thiovulaceae bacterium]|nr:hypothetical protein [Sulfurimonadaceae bacterium]